MLSDEYRSADDRIAFPPPKSTFLSISSYWDTRYRMTRRGIISRDDELSVMLSNGIFAENEPTLRV
jgi:hypothetical protein